MSLLHALILGCVEGFTEFLPISSTGHLILLGHVLQLPETEFLKSFDITIQLGAIAAVMVYYFRSFFDLEIIKRLIVAFLPTGVIGLAFYSIVKTYLLGNELVVLTSLAVGGLALIVFEMLRTHEAADMSLSEIPYGQALLIGLFQSIAIIPGVSRSAATIVGGLLLGIPRSTIVEFSFLLAVPTMAAATGLDLLKHYSSFAAADIAALIVGFAAAFVVALLSIRWLLAYVRSYSFIPFGIYRIAIAALFFFFVF